MARFPRWTGACAAVALVASLTAPTFASPVDDAGGNTQLGADNLSIGDFIWSDVNGNGCQDPGEPGVPGVVVDLVQNGVYLQEVTTDANGHYVFTGLYSGTYRVEIKPPCPLTKTNACSSALDSNTNPTYVTLQYDDNLTIDFGLTCPPVQQGCNCTLGYTDHSNDPRSSVVFNESTVLRTFDPGPATCAAVGGKIKLWYNDEHALTLGVRRVIVKNVGSTTTTDYPIAPTPGSPTGISNPQVGSQVASGPQAGNDVAAGGGRPIWPALFITDLSVNGPNSRAGDWQQGGTGVKPSAVYGTWKGAVRTVDATKNPPVVTVVCDKDPAKNNWTLGAGSDVPAGGFSKWKNEGFGAEVVWNVSDLGLDPTHSYRLQFMVHDGDQNKSGGDVGQACTTLPALPSLVIGPGDAAQAQATISPVQVPASSFAASIATPNPFRESVRFSYTVSGSERVDIGVFDLAGRKVRTLVAAEQTSGSHATQWDGTSDSGERMTRGVYFLHARVGGEQLTTRLMYLK